MSTRAMAKMRAAKGEGGLEEALRHVAGVASGSESESEDEAPSAFGVRLRASLPALLRVSRGANGAEPGYAGI